MKEHTHEHTHAETKAVVNRLSRAIGHLEAVKTMVEEGRDCTQVLIQLAAVKSAINGQADSEGPPEPLHGGGGQKRRPEGH